jgi:hypothetical protein
VAELHARHPRQLGLQRSEVEPTDNLLDLLVALGGERPPLAALVEENQPRRLQPPQVARSVPPIVRDAEREEDVRDLRRGEPAIAVAQPG